MLKSLGLMAALTTVLSASPITFTGSGFAAGTAGVLDLVGNGFSWHIVSDSGRFMGALCTIGVSCDLGLGFPAVSSGGITSVNGTWDGQEWGFGPPTVYAAAKTLASWTFQTGVAPGQSFQVPFAIQGEIGTSPNEIRPGLDLVFAGSGTQSITVGPFVTNSNLEVKFGALEFSGSIVDTRSEVPEPATLGLLVAGALAVAALLQRPGSTPTQFSQRRPLG